MATIEGPLTLISDGPKQRMRKAFGLWLSRTFGRQSLKGHAAPQPLVSDTMWFNAWTKAPMGSDGKPASLSAIPEDFIRENIDTIPFLGLREYWYPLAPSDEIGNDSAKAYTICGDEIVAFRGADGSVSALENRCPHRKVLMSLGQVNVMGPGTLTCRYHGLTVDGTGQCISVIADGPDSRAAQVIKMRCYPTDEVGGIVWIYMGEKTPRSVLEDVPRAREVLKGRVFMTRIPIPTSHLNVLDNQADLAHPSVLHRTCLPFAGQRLFGKLKVEKVEDYGLHISYEDGDPEAHPGGLYIKEIEWHLPNVAFFPRGSLMGPEFRKAVNGWHWPVPHTISTTTAWFILPLPDGLSGSIVKKLLPTQTNMLLPGNFKACVTSDIAMMIASGPVAQWTEEKLFQTDIGVVQARNMLKRKHKEEVAGRQSRQ